MNQDTERLIRDSWMRVVPIRLTAAQIFYDRLFEIDPSAKALFDGTPMHKQYDKFVQTIDTLVQMLDFPATIIQDLKALARRHVGYGVNLEQYATVGAALLWWHVLQFHGFASKASMISLAVSFTERDP